MAAGYLMAMMRSAILIVGLVAACTPAAYQKPGATPLQTYADQQECRSMAFAEAGPMLGFGWSGFGYRRRVFGDPLLDRMQRESALADFCMRARGYRLQPIPNPS